MAIHIVSEGESVYSIARQFGISPERIITDNALIYPYSLAVGQALLILIPSDVYSVRANDTIYSIARQFGTTPEAIFRNNPALRGDFRIYEGQTIVLSYEGESDEREEIFTTGYAYPFIESDPLETTLPYLTTISAFTYGFRYDGTLVPLDDERILSASSIYSCAPIMLLSTLGDDGRFDSALSSAVFNDQGALDTLYSQILETIEEKGYRGLEIDIEYIPPADTDAFISFLSDLKAILSPRGLILSVALAPKTSADQSGLLYEAHDYKRIGAIADVVFLMTYEWGYAYGPPMSVAPIGSVRAVVRYALSEMSAEKIILGIPNYGYDWTLPYYTGATRARTISNSEAILIAAKENATIEFDERAMTPFFFYRDDDGREHVVHFEDARSIAARLDLRDEYRLRGVGAWNLGSFFPALWLQVNYRYGIESL